MTTIYDSLPSELIKKASVGLKNEIVIPEWAKFVKTSPANSRPPADPEWFYMRAASVLRKVYMQGPIGTNKLSVKYGKKKNRGMQPEKFKRGSRKIIRNILQQLEKKGYIIQKEKSGHKGRIITPKGKKFLDSLAK